MNDFSRNGEGLPLRSLRIYGAGGLGQRGRDCWPEIWEIIDPQIQHVMHEGGATCNEDQLVPVFRDGKIEETYWTFAYSPVRDLDGNVLAALVTCTETTGNQLAARNLRQELNHLSELFDRAPASFALLRGAELVFERTNPLYQRLLSSLISAASRFTRAHWKDCSRCGARGQGTSFYRVA